jgi:hypothetical protein
LFVTPLVKASMRLTTVLDAFSMPPTMVLAKSAPGSVGSVTGVPLPVGEPDGTGADGAAWPV